MRKAEGSLSLRRHASRADVLVDNRALKRKGGRVGYRVRKPQKETRQQTNREVGRRDMRAGSSFSRFKDGGLGRWPPGRVLDALPCTTTFFFLSFSRQPYRGRGIQPQDASTVRWSVACGRMVRGGVLCGWSRLVGSGLGERPLLPPRDVGSKSKVEKVRRKGTCSGDDGLSATTGRGLGEKDIKVLY